MHTSIAAPGKYLYEGTLDGTTSGCTVDVPNGLLGQRTITCAAGVELIDELSPDSTIWSFGVLFETATANEVTFRGTHDAKLISDKTFAPVYVSEPGPNGPLCEPKECLVAHSTFP